MRHLNGAYCLYGWHTCHQYLFRLEIPPLFPCCSSLLAPYIVVAPCLGSLASSGGQGTLQHAANPGEHRPQGAAEDLAVRYGLWLLTAIGPNGYIGFQGTGSWHNLMNDDAFGPRLVQVEYSALVPRKRGGTVRFLAIDSNRAKWVGPGLLPSSTAP